MPEAAGIVADTHLWVVNMLLRFGGSNFLSLKEFQEVSLVATKLKDDSGHVIEHAGIGTGVLPGIAIYGANASGKTNILNCIYFIRSAIRLSHKEGSASGGLPVKQFLLSKECGKIPTQLDCDFIIDGVRYHYGFSANKMEILKEWLYFYPNNRRRILFFRNGHDPIYFGKDFPAKNKARYIESFMRPNSLFVSTAAQNNIDIASRVYSYFDKSIVVFTPNSSAENHLSESLDDPKTAELIINFIKAADNNISSAKLEEIEVPESARAFMDDFAELMNKHKTNIDIKASINKKILKFYHAGDDEDVLFPPESESKGTQQLVSLLGPMLTALNNGSILIIDEIDTSLHPILTMKLIELFFNKEINKNNAQIIFTTHDTNILCSNFIRRDQIWLAEKKCGASNIFSLSELSLRKSENLQKGYMHSQYGGVPFLSGVDRLFGRRMNNGRNAGGRENGGQNG